MARHMYMSTSLKWEETFTYPDYCLTSCNTKAIACADKCRAEKTLRRFENDKDKNMYLNYCFTECQRENVLNSLNTCSSQ